MAFRPCGGLDEAFRPLTAEQTLVFGQRTFLLSRNYDEVASIKLNVNTYVLYINVRNIWFPPQSRLSKPRDTKPCCCMIDIQVFPEWLGICSAQQAGLLVFVCSAANVSRYSASLVVTTTHSLGLLPVKTDCTLTHI